MIAQCNFGKLSENKNKHPSKRAKLLDGKFAQNREFSVTVKPQFTGPRYTVFHLGHAIVKLFFLRFIFFDSVVLDLLLLLFPT